MGYAQALTTARTSPCNRQSNFRTNLMRVGCNKRLAAVKKLSLASPIGAFDRAYPRQNSVADFLLALLYGVSR